MLAIQPTLANSTEAEVGVSYLLMQSMLNEPTKNNPKDIYLQTNLFLKNSMLPQITKSCNIYDTLKLFLKNKNLQSGYQRKKLVALRKYSSFNFAESVEANFL